LGEIRERQSLGAAFHSRFGGMWIDRDDWQAQLDRRLKDGRLTPADAANLQTFVRDGVLILQNAAEPAALANFSAAVSRAFREGHDGMLLMQPGNLEPEPLRAGVNRLGTRLADAYMALPDARALLASPPLIRFLKILFDEDPLLFQSLSFDQGSQQGLHQDTAYVRVDRPMEMVACWIALEDIQAGSGELMYVRGSHRLPDYPFGDRKHWSASEDGAAVHDRWSKWILDETRERGMKTESFIAKKGDILIWHADLAHGGRPVVDPALTRRSLVGHFCPASARPDYFNTLRFQPKVRSVGPLHYASGHYNRLERTLIRLRRWRRRLLGRPSQA
jgi:phytanoyl-CoA hydroxylase